MTSKHYVYGFFKSQLRRNSPDFVRFDKYTSMGMGRVRQRPCSYY